MREEQSEEVKAMERNFTRDWKVGDVYAPHDLSAAEARKWRAKKAPTTDAFDVLSLNPLDLYKVWQLANMAGLSLTLHRISQSCQST